MAMKTLLCLILIAAPVLAQAPNYDYGKLEELRGLKKVFIDTGTDLENRARIVKELDKSGLGFEIMSARTGAELILAFGAEEKTTGAHVHTLPPFSAGLPARSRVEYEQNKVGQGVAYVPAENRARLLFSWTGVQRILAKSATRFTVAFVKAYKKANGLK
jgi:hypothetical protein